MKSVALDLDIHEANALIALLSVAADDDLETLARLLAVRNRLRQLTRWAQR
jgi:hypothetical protein